MQVWSLYLDFCCWSSVYNFGFRGGAASNVDSFPFHIHPEDGNYNVCRNVGNLPTFDVAHPRKPKLYYIYASFVSVRRILSPRLFIKH
jgi:hypothetical protein